MKRYDWKYFESLLFIVFLLSALFPNVFFMSLVMAASQNDENGAASPQIPSAYRKIVDTMRKLIKNHGNGNRAFFKIRLFHTENIDSKGSIPHSCEDPPVFPEGTPERKRKESASHHRIPRTGRLNTL